MMQQHGFHFSGRVMKHKSATHKVINLVMQRFMTLCAMSLQMYLQNLLTLPLDSSTIGLTLWTSRKDHPNHGSIGCQRQSNRRFRSR